MSKNNKKHNKVLWIIWLILGGFLVKILHFFIKKKDDIEDNFEDFMEEEERETKELASGKESLTKYCSDSFYLFKDYFIPNDNNEHKPKMLRSRSLLIIAIALILLKATVTGYLFFIYPNTARMTEVMLSRIFELTNLSRKENGVQELSLNPILTASAKAKAEDMIANNYFAHYSPNGKKPWDWINRSQYPYLFVGENLAMNFSSAESAHNALMQSPSHKENILNNRFDNVGFAALSGEINGEQTNVLVELFATKKELEIASTVNEPKPAEEVVEEPEETPSQSVKVEAAQEEIVAESVEPTKNTSDQTIEQPQENIIPNEGQTESTKSEPSKIAEENINIATATPIAAVDNKNEAEVIKEEKSEEKFNEAQKIEPAPIISNVEVAYFSQEDTRELSAAAILIKISKYIYLAVLILLSIALAINIFVRITIQHKPIIIQTLILIIFIAGLISIHLHFLEGLLGNVAII